MHECRWKLSNSTCHHRGSENNKHKAIISSVNKALIIQMKIMIDEKRIMAYDIKEVSKTRLKICGSTYKVSSCIFHHGFNIDKGDYSVMMRNGASS